MALQPRRKIAIVGAGAGGVLLAGALGFHIQTLIHDDLRQRSLAETGELYRRFAANTLLLIPAEE
ncbi:MAG TPA: hypothetical protein VIJ94_14570, partial [Caulobacteraceae bacterium]